MKAPVLSIVTVTAFEVERLRRTLDSAKFLSKHVEHIIVIPENDLVGKQIIEEYSKSRIEPTSIVFDEKAGIYPAMNLGLMNANGTYVHFLNSGDEILNAKIFEANLELIEQLKPEWSILGCALPWNEQYSTYPDMEIDFLLQKSKAYVSHQSVLAKRDLLNALGGFDPRFSIAADTLMTMRLANVCGPLLLDGISVKVEKGATVTESNRLSRFQTIRAVFLTTRGLNLIVAFSNILKKELHFLSRRILNIFNN